MITLLASIAGFISSLLPELLRLLRDKADKTHELHIMTKQIEFSKISNNQPRIEEINLKHEAIERQALYSTYKTGISWVDGLNGTVRPVLAYSFFIMYASLKIAQYRTITTSMLAIEYIDILWSIEDQAIFAGIISFYFGQRTLNKLTK
jgi:hypothetical protein